MSALLPTGAGPLAGFDDWWNAAGEWVEPPNERRGGNSGVMRLLDQAGRLLYSKRQIGHLFRSLRHPFGRPTVLREEKTLRALRQYGITVPDIVFCGAVRHNRQWHALLVTEALDGYLSLHDWLASDGYRQAGAAQRAEVMQAIAATLAALHRKRWQHGCLYPKHIFLRLEDGKPPKIALLDLEKSRRRWRAARAARHDLQQLRRHRETLADADWQALVSHYRSLTGSNPLA